jgi:hypothetical protein
LALALVVACSDTRGDVSDVSPTPIASPVPSGSLVTGFVLENTGGERLPVPGARVLAVDLVEGPYGNYPWHETMTDVAGRFTLPAYVNRMTRITAYAPGTLGPLWSRSTYQVCAVHPIVNGHTVADVELTRAGVDGSVRVSPTLSGLIYEDTPTGRRPAARMAVLYSSNGHDGADAYTRTDDAGRYSFCNVPLGGGYVLPACARSASPPEHPVNVFRVQIAGNTVFDAECH